jgi:hypothetical protein
LSNYETGMFITTAFTSQPIAFRERKNPMPKSRQACLAALRAASHVIEPGRKFVVDDFRPGDGPGVARLYYAVYGEMFPVDHVYDPDELVRLNAGPDLHQVVGRTDTGDIVGLYALFRNPPGRRIMEAGSWIVHPAYRTSSLAMRLAAKIHTTPPDRLGVDVIFGQTVCDHVTTQKMGLKYKSFYSALEIEAMPPRPEEHAGPDSDRISLLDGFIILRDQPHAVYLPRQYADVMTALYAGRDLDREFRGDPGPDGSTEAGIQPMDQAGLVKMTVDRIGPDFPAVLARMERDFPDRHVSQIVLPLGRPGCTAAVDAARAEGYFLGGLLPLWYDQDGLLLQKLAGEPDYSKIKLYPEEARMLLDLIRSDRDRPAKTP